MDKTYLHSGEHSTEQTLGECSLSAEKKKDIAIFFFTKFTKTQIKMFFYLELLALTLNLCSNCSMTSFVVIRVVILTLVDVPYDGVKIDV